jgi:plasmid maintenance system killer protein
MGEHREGRIPEAGYAACRGGPERPAQPTRKPPEALRGDRAGQYSVRANDQWRIWFRWTDVGPADVEITDYH